MMASSSPASRPRPPGGLRPALTPAADATVQRSTEDRSGEGKRQNQVSTVSGDCRDIGKAELVCCVRVPGGPAKSKRVQEVITYRTMTRSLLRMVDRLRELAVTRVVMEATSDYWKPPFYLLEAAGFETWLVNAKDVKHLPGRPKTDRLDAVWLCKVAERQMLRPSFVPPVQIRVLRDLTRYRWDQVAVRTAEKQRVEKLLEDAQIKLSVVASDIFGVSGRDMLGALISGQRDPKVLAQYARGRMRGKITDLEEAFTGWFSDHHAFLLAKMLTRIDAVSADVAELDARIEAELVPFAEADHLAAALRPRGPLRRPRRRVLQRPHQHQHQEAQPHPPARSPWLQGHPRTRRLNPRETPRPASPEAVACPLTIHFRTSVRSPAAISPHRHGCEPRRRSTRGPTRARSRSLVPRRQNRRPAGHRRAAESLGPATSQTWADGTWLVMRRASFSDLPASRTPSG